MTSIVPPNPRKITPNPASVMESFERISVTFYLCTAGLNTAFPSRLQQAHRGEKCVRIVEVYCHPRNSPLPARRANFHGRPEREENVGLCLFGEIDIIRRRR